MERRRITKRVVDSLQATGSEYQVWDSDLPAFAIRVRASGAASYVVMTRAGSGRTAPLRRVTLGAVGKLTPDDARTLAKRVLADVAHGRDPAAERTAERKGLTVSGLIDLFLTEHVEPKRKSSTATLYSDYLNRIVRPALGTERASKVTRAAVARLHLQCKATPYQANRVLAVLASMFSFAARRGIVPEGFNPARGIEKYREEGRERFLTADELDRLGAALREAETVGIPWSLDERKPISKHVPKENRRTVLSPFATAAIRLLLFTGARLREILHLKWEHVDFERGLLFLPDSKTGKKTIVLGAPALDVLAGLPRASEFVVAGDDPSKPRADLKRPWAVVSKRAGLSGVRIHDLRHTHASIGAGAGLGLPIIGRLLGHAQASTTARYAHLDADPLRRASETISKRIAAALGQESLSTSEQAVVVPLRKA